MQRIGSYSKITKPQTGDKMANRKTDKGTQMTRAHRDWFADSGGQQQRRHTTSRTCVCVDGTDEATGTPYATESAFVGGIVCAVAVPGSSLSCFVVDDRLPYLLNQVDTGQQIHTEIDKGPVDALTLVLLLLQHKHVMVEELLQLLVGEVDAQLLKTVVLHAVQ